MKEHIILAHQLWKKVLLQNDNVIDATCGNGHDTYFLSTITKGKIFAIDIQKKAIENTKKLLEEKNKTYFSKKIFLFNRSHKDFSFIKEEIKLIVYNLGYLPGADKSITTKAKDTLISIKNGISLIKKGFLSIMCYPGHAEGKKEEKEIISFLSTLNSNKFKILFHKWINKKNFPSFIWIEKID